MFYVFVISTVMLFIIALFAFPQFSPIPYYPSNMKDKKNILKALSLKNNQTIVDLGAGDGVVVFEAAYESWRRKLDTKFLGIEINPVLIVILYLKWILHPNRKNIRIIWGDMFKLNYQRLTTDDQRLTTFYLYISPWLIEKVISRIQKQLPHSSFVSYFYPIKSLGKEEVVLKGVHNTYCYPSNFNIPSGESTT